jgi:hypothetical protein
MVALPCIQRILDANRLTWSDVGHHPDCQFASFIQASQQEQNGDLIIKIAMTSVKQPLSNNLCQVVRNDENSNLGQQGPLARH